MNGKKADSTFEIKIIKSTNSLKRLKDVILSYLELSRQYMDRMMIYNYKGLELDDVDVPYLNPEEVLYLSMDGSSFSVLNYIYEYEIVKWIKAGGYGRVFLGRHVLKRDFYAAVKKIDISNLSTDEIYSISREALYLQSFTHKNIIKYINSYTYENHFYTVMDWAQGGELVNYLTEQKILSEQECKRIFQQIHDAVRYIHSRNVIHRDLKPNNILFLDTKRQNLVLIDFGISGYNSGNVKETIKAGTTKFIPPELAAGITYSSSPKFDIWALGVILYFMLFGSFPFDGAKDSDIVNKIIKENHKFPNNITISKSAYNLINGLLEKNASLRIELNDNLFQDWYNDTNSADKPLVRQEESHIKDIKINDNLLDYGGNYIHNPVPQLQNLKPQKNGSIDKLPFIKVSNNIGIAKSRRAGSVEKRVVQKNSSTSNPALIPIKKTKTTAGSSNIISYNKKDTILKKTNKK